MSEGPATDVHFAKDKYGSELLVDVGVVSELDGFIVDDTAHRLSFYDLTLVTSGSGWLWLDTTRLKVAPGAVLFTSPNQIRRWQVSDLDGVCLFFEPDFLSEFFNDALFIQRLIFFHSPAGPVGLDLTEVEDRWLQERLLGMRAELNPLKEDSAHLLRAALYEVLITLNRWVQERAGVEALRAELRPAMAFRQEVEAHYSTLHEVQGYARRLSITPGHLNYLAKTHLGSSAGSIIRGRILLEAKRMLLHSERSVSGVAADLGFRDPSYFSRFFRREVGQSPSVYRRVIREKYHS